MKDLMVLIALVCLPVSAIFLMVFVLFNAAEWALGSSLVMLVSGLYLMISIWIDDFGELQNSRALHWGEGLNFRFTDQEWQDYLSFRISDLRTGLLAVGIPLVVGGGGFYWFSDSLPYPFGEAMALGSAALALLFVTLSAKIIYRLKSEEPVLRISDTGFSVGSKFNAWTKMGLREESLRSASLTPYKSIQVLELFFYATRKLTRRLEVPFPQSAAQVAKTIHARFKVYLRKR